MERVMSVLFSMLICIFHFFMLWTSHRLTVDSACTVQGPRNVAAIREKPCLAAYFRGQESITVQLSAGLYGARIIYGDGVLATMATAGVYIRSVARQVAGNGRSGRRAGIYIVD